MSSRSRIPVVLAAVLTIAGCHPRGDEGPKGGRFQAEEARKAIVEMVEESHDEILILGLPYLKTEKAVAAGPSRVAIGQWRIDLDTRAFVLSLASEAGFYEVSGVFEQSHGGKWRAKITRTTQS